MEVAISTVCLTVLLAYFLVLLVRKRVKVWLAFRGMPRIEESPLPLLGHALQFRGDLAKAYAELIRVTKRIRERGYQAGYMWMGSEPIVMVTGPEAAEVLLRSSNHITKSMFYDFLHPWLGTGLLTADGEKWKSRRRLLTPTFHFNILQDFLEVMNEQSLTFMHKIEPFSTAQETFDIFKPVTLCALDIICETAMGKSVNAQIENDSEYVTAIYRTSELLQDRQRSPWLWPDVIYYATSGGQEFAKHLRVLHGVTEKIIFDKMKEKRQTESVTTKKKRLAFLDMLLDVSEGGNVLSFRDIQEEVDTFMFEGHDTTAAAMSWAFHLIGSHKDVQTKLHQEVDKVFEKKSDGAALTMDDLRSLEYLEMVIKESLRVFPSVPIYGRTTTKDCIIDGHNVPSGTQAIIFTQVVNSHPKYWKEPQKFLPERFTKDESAGRHPYCYVPFSAGPRNCIGQRFALMEEKVILAHFLRKYSITSCDRTEDMQLLGDIILRPGNGVKVKITKRNET